MTMNHTCILQDRAVLKIAGKDAQTLLQGLITNDLDRLEEDGLAFGALLSPQGKIQFDFFIHQRGDHFLFEMDETRAPDFIKRLTLYRLRSDLTFSDISADHHVMVSWGAEATSPRDPRSPEIGCRQIVSENATPNATEEAYHLHRITLGVPEGGKDFAFDDIFPHDAMMDLLDGVHFDKGCYVGQEVVSRVQHRSNARKRFFIVEKTSALPPMGTPVHLEDKSVGQLGTPFQDQALALLRIDKIADNEANLTAEGTPITVRKPSYLSHSEEELS